MDRGSVILRNVASNWVGYAVNAAVTLALTPFILRHLGTAGYGIWVLSSSVIGYYGLLDVGFRAGVTQYLTRYMAAGDMRRASECMTAAIAALAVFGALLTAMSVGVAFAVPHLFQLPPDLINEAFWCVLVVGTSAGIQFALSPYTSIFAATQRFDLANVIGVGSRLVTALGIVIVLKAGHGLVGVSVVTCVVSLLDYLVRWWVSRRLAPQIEVSRQLLNLGRLKEISSFGAWNFLISINIYVYIHVPAVLVGLFMPVAAVGHYSLAMGLVRQIISIVGPIGQVMYPAAAAADVRGDRSGLERLYHNGSRLLMLVMLSLALNAFFWAEDFYRLWIGPAYLEGGQFHSVALLFQVLLVSTMAASSSIAAPILMGAGHVRTVALALISSSVINLTLILILIEPFGLLGVALGAATGSILIDLFAMPLLLQKIMGLPVMGYLRNACVRPVSAAVLQAGLLACVQAVGDTASWLSLAVHAALSGIGCLIIIVFIGITPEERVRFVLRPLHKVLRRMSGGGPVPGAGS